MHTSLLILVCASFASAWELPSFLSQNFDYDESLLSPRELYALNETIVESGEAILRQLNETEQADMEQNLTSQTEYVATESPTESPAPSPSPSEMPTIRPTITARKFYH
jgi:hypothetical protein